MYSGEYIMFVMLLWVYIYTGHAWKICLATVGIEPTTFGILAQCSTNWATRSGQLIAQLAEHWASIPKVVGSIPTVARHIWYNVENYVEDRYLISERFYKYCIYTCSDCISLPT